MSMTSSANVLDQGQLSFTIESRIIRELGERLVKQPEIAVLELVKNSYDADATICRIIHRYPEEIRVADDGHGMTLDEFKNGWMRIGTSSKETEASSREYSRVITGEKGIGRFAVRFLGTRLHLECVAYDDKRRYRTHLSADFNWPQFDRTEDLGQVKVPYVLRKAEEGENQGTELTITELRQTAETIDFGEVRTGSMNVVTPYHTLMRRMHEAESESAQAPRDPGFSLVFGESTNSDSDDVAGEVLSNYVLRAVLETRSNRVTLRVYGKDGGDPKVKISDRIKDIAGPVYADIRFFPQRGGTFRGLEVDGRRAKTWVKEHSGVAVFDRMFRVYPYGAAGDDWLTIEADGARNLREPRSSIARKHLVMDEPTRRSTELNYMLRLPHTEQLVGVVQVRGQRIREQGGAEDGLIPAADREGFLHNAAYKQLKDLVRGAVEAIAYVDRELQIEEKREEEKELLRELRKETREAIKEIESNAQISRNVRLSLVRNLTNAQRAADEYADVSRERQAALEIMSLLGVVAGFMTHEFGAAIDDLQKAQDVIQRLAKRQPEFVDHAQTLAARISSLRDFVTYSQGYIQGASQEPHKPYSVRPRIQQAIRIFGKYAEERGIKLSTDISPDLLAPLVPVSLYNGIALNLYTNALKAVIAKTGSGKREITFRAWNEQKAHYLEVSDTGIGIPAALKSRAFDPLFTTTSSNRDPLGSGMGLGLTLVKRGVEAFGGRVEVVDPPPGFSTCFRVKLPIDVSQL
jgi:signal transduction histidine kinase